MKDADKTVAKTGSSINRLDKLQRPTEVEERPKFGQTVLEDLRRGDFQVTMKRDWHDVIQFYLDEEDLDELEDMGVFKKWLFSTWWLMKSMFFKLTPARRIILLISVVLFFNGADRMDGTVVLSFMGLLLILVPEGHLSITTVSYLGLVLGLSSGMFNSLELITLRWLRQSDTAHTINLWYAGITIILTLPFAIGSPWPDQPMIWFFAIMFALFSFAGQTLQAEAMQTITPTVASVSCLLVPAFATLIGWIVFGQLLSGIELVGITVVLTAGALVQLRESRQRDTLSATKFRWQE